MSEFKVGDKTYKLLNKTRALEDEAHRVYLKTLRQAIEQEDAMLNASMDNFLKEKNAWTDADEAQIDKLRSELVVIEDVLQSGGIKLQEAKEKALEAQQIRMKLVSKMNEKSSYYELTAESRADEAKFNYMLVKLLVDEQGNPVFNTVEEFLNSEDEQLGGSAATALTEKLYGNVKDAFKETVENKFLIEYGFADENLVLKDKKKKEFSPFLDDDGKPVEKK